jgi:hypothetical protein
MVMTVVGQEYSAAKISRCSRASKNDIEHARNDGALLSEQARSMQQIIRDVVLAAVSKARSALLQSR